MRIKLGHSPINEYFCNRLGSSFEYEQTKESFGITELPIDVKIDYKIRSKTIEEPTTSPVQSTKGKLVETSLLPVIQVPHKGSSSSEFMYTYLAECQKTEIAVTAVHTDAEVKLYQEFMVDPEKRSLISLNGDKRIPNFKSFARLWSEYCIKGNNIYFKTERHLESYHNILVDRKKYSDSIHLNIGIVDEVRSTLNSETRNVTSLPANKRPHSPSLEDQLELVGQEPLPQLPVNTAPIYRELLPLPPPAITYRVFNRSLILPQPMIPTGLHLSNNQAAVPVATSKKKKRARRVCSVCNEEEAKPCTGGIKQFMCIFRCGVCKINSCPGRYKGESCSNPK